MSDTYINLPETGSPSWKKPVANTAALPLTGNGNGDVRVTLDTDSIYIWNGVSWVIASGGGGGVTSVTASGPLASSGGTTPNITIQNADATHTGALTSTDWNTFNNKQNALTLGNLTDVGTDGITITGGTGAVIGSGTSIAQQKSDASHNGYLSATDWITFNNKLSPSSSNYITNPDAEVNTTGWNLYNDSGNTKAATVIAQDITYTAVASGNAGNGINIDYIFHPTQSYTTPLVTVVNPTLITVAWYNGPTIANNPTATQLKAAFDAVPGAVALATSAITGVAGNKQYETGSNITANGGDTAPVDGTGGSPSGVTFTRNTSTPLAGVASFDLGKIAANEQGQGVSTDFIINSIDTNKTLQINFAYEGSSGMVLGSSSDVRVFVYDITNATLIPVTSTGASLPGPVSTPLTFSGQFASSSSVNYRLIIHIATISAVAWDLLLDNVTVNSELNATTATQVPSLVLLGQPISGAVTDHMCVMWRDGASQWVPATIAGAALPVFGDDKTQLGFATNIIGLTADIYIRGAMDGFSFGPFTGYQQYIDNTAGLISPLPSPFNDMYVMVGMAISSTVLNVQFDTHVDLISNSSGVPIKGGLLTSSAVNDGTGDLVLSPGTNGNVLVANSAQTLGLQWAPAVVATSPLVYTTATRALTLSTVPIASGGTGLTTTSQSFVFIGPSGGAGAPTWRLLVAADVPTLNQNTTGSAAKLTTARTIAGTSFDGSANVTLANKFIVQGTTDAGLTGAQFLGALGTGIVKNTTSTGILSIAVAGDFPTLNQNTTGSAASLSATLAIGSGGTGQTTANAAFNALSPMTTLGDIIYENATPVAARLAGNTTTAKQYLSQTGNGTISAAPVWATIASTDITNSSSVSGTTVTDALNTIGGNFNEVYLSAIKNAGAVTANTEIPTWTTVTKDTNSAFNSSTGTYTVPVAGDYEVTFTAALTVGTPTAQIYYNGVLVQSGVGSLTRTTVTFFISNAAVNDTIWVALDTTGTLTSTTTDTTLNICKVVGPGVGPVNARYHSSATAITASLTTMTYTTKDFDTQAAAYSSGVYTVPSAGKYNVKASMAITATTVAAGNTQVIIIRKNSTEVARYEFISGAATQKPAILIVDDLISCAASDTIDIQISSASTTPSITASTTMNFFYINKVSI